MRRSERTSSLAGARAALTTAGVSVEEVIEAVRRRLVAMAPETAGYLVLAAADQLATAPAFVDMRRCSLSIDGGRVLIAREAGPATALESERALRTMLHRLLQSTSGGAPALNAVAAASAKGDVSGLVAELESALIPVNRAAAARALSRLARETRRALGAHDVPSSLDASDDDTAENESGDTEPLDLRVAVPAVAPVLPEPSNLAGTAFDVPDLELPGELRGRWGTRSAPSGSGAPVAPLGSAAPARGVDELLEGFMADDAEQEAQLVDDLRHLAGVDELVLAAPPRAETPFESIAIEQLAHHTPQPGDRRTGARAGDRGPFGAGRRDGAPAGRPPNTRWGLRVAVILSVAAAASWLIAPDRVTALIEDLLHSNARGTVAVGTPPADACHATVLITDVPEGAEVLVRAGVSPVDVAPRATSARLEFVATADGYAPRRAAVPSSAAGAAFGDKPRFELAIQLEKSRANGTAIDPWPSPDSGRSAEAATWPGTVHVVTSPTGAEVWTVAGGSPETRIDALPCGTSLDLLVAGVSSGEPFRRRLRVDSGQTTPVGSAAAVVGRVSASR